MHEDIAATYRRTMSSGRALLAEMVGGQVEVDSSGAWVTTSDGRNFLNVGGYGVLITGACHPVVVEEVESQLRRHPTGTRIFLDPVAAEAAELLTSVTPQGLNRVHFSCSGAEAVEAAIKIARLNGRRHLVSMTSGYHGKTMGALSITAKNAFQEPFLPLLPGVSEVPFGDSDALTAVLRQHSGEACVFLEPVQGEGGVIIPPEGYLRKVRALCSEHGALLVADEVQTGLGRLGSWWGSEPEGLCPDILLSGKSLGGGVMAVAATITTDELFAVLDRDPILHTSTFSAAPIAMAAVRGAIRVIRDEGLVERAADLGQQILPALKKVMSAELPHHSHEVRGRGLLIGIDFDDPALAVDFFMTLVSNGVIANMSLSSDHVIRLTPPATMSQSEVDYLIEKFELTVQMLAKNNPEFEVL